MEQNVLSINGKLLVVEKSLVIPKINLQEKEVIPSNQPQTVSPDEGYLGMSSVIVNGDENLVPENIISGKTIFGVEGTSSGVNFSVVGCATQPISPSENTIWVETDTEMSEFTIVPDNQIPTNPVEGMVWIVNSDASIGNFDVLDVNSLWLYPTTARQYVAGQWITRALQIYKDGEWIDLFPEVATIAVTYTEGFVCMCSNGEVTFVAPDTSGYYVFPIPTMGTWTISCPDERFVESKDVVIDTEGQSENISVLYFPATITVTYPESTLTVTNGVRTFSHAGGGTVTFDVDQAGDWSVSVLNTEDSHYVGNTTVTISTAGENKSVTIAKFVATINVTYPNGTCTCTCGSTSYSHSGGGTKSFVVNKAGTWTITTTRSDGITESKTASITSNGQTANVTLTCPRYLFKSGTGFLSAFMINGGNIKVDANTSRIKINTQPIWDSRIGYHTNSLVNLAPYKTLKFDVSAINTGGTSFCSMGAHSTTFTGWNPDYGALDFRHYVGAATSERQTFSVDVSSATGNYYVGVSGLFVAEFYNIWLE